MQSDFERAPLVPAQDQRPTNTPSEALTVERIERAKRTVAKMMLDHGMPHLIETIEFLDAELAKLRQRKAAMDVAREILL